MPGPTTLAAAGPVTVSQLADDDGDQLQLDAVVTIVLPAPPDEEKLALSWDSVTGHPMITV